MMREDDQKQATEHDGRISGSSWGTGCFFCFPFKCPRCNPFQVAAVISSSPVPVGTAHT